MKFNPKQERFLRTQLIPLRLSCILPNGFPLTISLWYQYHEGKLICASGKSSKIISYLQTSQKVGFEIASDNPPYCGIRGYGTVSLEPDINNQTIKNLYHRYFVNEDSQLYQFLTADNRDEIVITITPNQIFDWNFSDRMQDSEYRGNTKICF